MIGHCLPTILEGHFVFPWDQILKLYSETKVWDLINMQNVLNHFTDRSSPLTGRRRKIFFIYFQRSVRGCYYAALSYDVIYDVFVLFTFA